MQLIMSIPINKVQPTVTLTAHANYQEDCRWKRASLSHAFYFLPILPCLGGSIKNAIGVSEEMG